MQLKWLGGPTRLVQRAESAGVTCRLARKGHWYPFLVKRLAWHRHVILAMSGQAPAIAKAVRELRAGLPPDECAGDPFDLALTFLLPHTMRGPLIGRSGATIKEARLTTGASIEIEDLERGIPEFRVVLRGCPEDIEKATSWMLSELPEHVEDMKSILITEYTTVEDVHVDCEIALKVSPKVAAAIIGTRGLKKQELALGFGVGIQVDDAVIDGQQSVTLRGPAGSVHALHLKILREVQNQESRSAGARKGANRKNV